MKVDIKLIAAELGKSLDTISDRIKQNIQTAIKQLSLNTYAEGQRLANQRLSSAREDYLNSLKYQDTGDDVYVIYLTDRGKMFEKGWDAFSMLHGLLHGPKSKVGADGKRYNTVPFRKKATAKGATPQIADTAAAIQAIIKNNDLEKIEKEIKGGKITTYKGIENPMLKGLTRITQLYTTKAGKQRKSSQYFVFRRVSENTDPSKWKHPGYEGAKIFPDLKKYVEMNMKRILKEIL